ncbi:MAG: AraC family transcriptional regulator ligand-binding domain-containing protein [Massilia sp.]
MPVLPAKPTTMLIRARALSGYAALVREHGGDGAALLGKVGIGIEALAAPDSLLCLKQVMSLLNDTAASLNLPDFALRLARRQDLQVLGAVALLAQRCPTLGHALAALERNMAYHCPGLRMTLEDDPARPTFWRCVFDFDVGTSAFRRQAIELCLGVAEQFFLSVSGGQAHDWQISFRHGSALSLADYEGALRSTVRLEQPVNALSFPGWLMQLPMPSDHAQRQESAACRDSHLVQRLPLDLPQRVETMVSRHLGDGGSSLVRIAQQMGMHERTLQRRLKEHGLVFEDIIDRVRRTRAEAYLLQSAMPLAELAAMLGYAEQSSFIRSCWRWFNMTPQAMRESSYS